MAPLLVHGTCTADVREGLKADLVRTGQLGRLQDRPKVVEIDEKFAAIPDIGRVVQFSSLLRAQQQGGTSCGARNQHS